MNQTSAADPLICDETDRSARWSTGWSSSPTAGRSSARPVNIYQVLEHVRRLAESGFGQGLRFEAHYDPSLPEVDGDRDQLVQVFLNLVKNAAEAVPGDGGEIRLSTQYTHGLSVRVANSGERVELPITVQIQDNGPGQPRDRRPSVRAVRVRPSAPAAASACRSWPRSSAITAAYRVRPPARGALFQVRLPAYRGSARPRKPRRARWPNRRDPGRRRRRDPDRDLARAVARGYRVQATAAAATLWRWIEDGTGDVAIIDVVLPDENTLDLLPRIKQRRRGLPIIVMSAQNALLTAVRATERGAFDYLAKPFDLDRTGDPGQARARPAAAGARGPRTPARPSGQLPIIGRSAPLQEIHRGASPAWWAPVSGADPGRERHRQGARRARDPRTRRAASSRSSRSTAPRPPS